MTVRGARPRLSDSSVVLYGPTDKSDPSNPLAIVSGSGTLRVYDEDRKAYIEADAIAAATEITVDSGLAFVVGDTVEIRLDDTVTLHTSTVTVVASTVVTIADAIPAGRYAPRGGYILKPIGTSVSMNIYNAAGALPDTKNWGWIGFVADDVDLWDVQNVREEVDFSGGAGLRIFKIRTEPVIWST